MTKAKPTYRLTWLNRKELAETGQTLAYEPPHVLPDTGEVTWGRWVTVRRHRRELIVCET